MILCVDSAESTASRKLVSQIVVHMIVHSLWLVYESGTLGGKYYAIVTLFLCPCYIQAELTV